MGQQEKGAIESWPHCFPVTASSSHPSAVSLAHLKGLFFVCFLAQDGLEEITDLRCAVVFILAAKEQGSSSGSKSGLGML